MAERAHQVQSAYERHARQLDRRISERNRRRGGLGAGPDDTTDVFDHLRSFTRVRGLVCGNYCECSPDVHELLAITADGLAARRWRLMGARSATEARAFFIARLRRSLSVVIAREMARHRLRRIPFIGVPRAAIRDRPPQRAQQGVQHLPHMAQLADFMRYQVHAAIKARAEMNSLRLVNPLPAPGTCASRARGRRDRPAAAEPVPRAPRGRKIAPRHRRNLLHIPTSGLYH